MIKVGRDIFHRYDIIFFTETMITYIPLIIYITILWLCSNLLYYTMGFPKGLGFNDCIKAGRQCCIGDAVVEVSIWFLLPPYFVISSCSNYI